MSFHLRRGAIKLIQGFRSGGKEVLRWDLLVQASSIPYLVLLVTTVLWILAIIPLRLGAPWNTISFTFGYGAIFMTAVTASRVAGMERGRIPEREARRMITLNGQGPCPTC